ncbi:hypothetical protein [Sphingomonas crocodyli]|uniref:Uncharacterized protein n=1 Tax=Sphingomonas crocodyli TaxID=1979270 RepID=A0A437LVI7_9SPHN|nr:hypothetical protein [Sphingomonas crocodyli]RVT89409.1 hypothetical protein EOD43_21840 [Sphingomonas crocodyli]
MRVIVCLLAGCGGLDNVLYMFYTDKMLRALILLVLSVFVGRRAFAQGGGGVMVRVMDAGAPRPDKLAMPCRRSGGPRGGRRPDTSAETPIAAIDPAFLPPAAFGIGFLRP